MLKRILLTLGVVGLLWAPTYIHAQDPQPAATATTQPAAPAAAATEAPSTPAPDAPAATTAAAAEQPAADQPAGDSEQPAPTVEELMGGAAKVINDWRTVGWLAGLIALLNLLVNLLRFGPINEWFTVNKKKWLKPYIAAGLGAVLGGFTTYQTSADVVQSIIMGLLAGLTAVGAHELITKRKVENRTA